MLEDCNDYSLSFWIKLARIRPDEYGVLMPLASCVSDSLCCVSRLAHPYWKDIACLWS